MSRVCVVCRRPVAGACDDPQHPVVDVDARTPAGVAGREALIAAAWGTPEQRIAARRLRYDRALWLALGGLVGGLVTAYGVLALGIHAAPVLVGALPIGALAGIGIVTLFRRRTDLDHFPLAAAPLPALPVRARATIAGPEELRSPGSGQIAAGWAISLSNRGRVLFRDAEVGELALVLEGGGRGHVAAGPWRLADEPPRLDDFDEPELTAHLRGIDHFYFPDDELSPFHHDTVHEELLVPGDRVELLGEWRTDEGVLVPVGLPTIRRLRR